MDSVFGFASICTKPVPDGKYCHFGALLSGPRSVESYFLQKNHVTFL
jgi:hypothetical protein